MITDAAGRSRSSLFNQCEMLSADVSHREVVVLTIKNARAFEVRAVVIGQRKLFHAAVSYATAGIFVLNVERVRQVGSIELGKVTGRTDSRIHRRVVRIIKMVVQLNRNADHTLDRGIRTKLFRWPVPVVDFFGVKLQRFPPGNFLAHIGRHLNSRQI